MSEPTSFANDSSTGPEAFEPQPVPAGKSGPGCSRLLLIGCGLLLVLLGIGAVLLVANGDKVLGWMFGVLENQVLATLPDDVPAADRERLERAFDRAETALHEGRLDPAKLQQAQGKMTGMARDPESITAEDVRELAELLEAAAGGAGESGGNGGESPAEAPTDG